MARARKDPEGSEDNGLPEAFRESLSRSAFATVRPGQAPRAADVWAALGGRRGVLESILPGVGFLVAYTLSQSLLWAVSVPLALSVLFIVIRLAQRSPLQPAVVGLVGVLASALVAVASGRPENNFLLGLWVNAAYLAIVVVSLLARRPLVGIVVGTLLADNDWRADRAKFAMASVATLLWAGLFAARLIVQVPLYLAGESAVSVLAATKLAMGIPLYGLCLWLTWLLLRSVYRGRHEKTADRI